MHLIRLIHVDVAVNNFAALVADHRFQDQESLQKALRLVEKFRTSQNPYFVDTLGWVHYRLGNFDDAQKLLEQAIRIGPSFPQVHFHLGMVYYSKNQMADAMTQLNAALKGKVRFPWTEEARTILKKLEATVGQP